MSGIQRYRVFKYDEIVEVDRNIIRFAILLFLNSVNNAPDLVDQYMIIASKPNHLNERGLFQDSEYAEFVGRVVVAVKACGEDAEKAREKIVEFRKELEQLFGKGAL